MYPGTPTSTVAKKALTATVPDLNRILYSTCIYYCIHARTMQYCTVRVLYRAHTMYPALPFHHTMYRTRVDVKGRRTLLHLMYPGTPTFALECGTCTPLDVDVPRYTRGRSRQSPKFGNLLKSHKNSREASFTMQNCHTKV